MLEETCCSDDTVDVAVPLEEKSAARWLKCGSRWQAISADSPCLNTLVVADSALVDNVAVENVVDGSRGIESCDALETVEAVSQEIVACGAFESFEVDAMWGPFMALGTGGACSQFVGIVGSMVQRWRFVVSVRFAGYLLH